MSKQTNSMDLGRQRLRFPQEATKSGEQGFSMNMWYRYAAVLGGIAGIVYTIETYGHTNLAELEAGDILFYGFAFLITQAAVIWGMLFDSPGEPSRLANAAPALLGSVLGGSYIIWATGSVQYFIIPLSIVAVATASVFLRRTWNAIRHPTKG